MNPRVVWCDDFVRLDPIRAGVLDGDNQKAWRPPVRLSCARNEFASFQLSVGPVGADHAACVIPADLVSERGARLPAGQFDVFVEWYQRYGGKWFPEVMVPQNLTGGSTPPLRRKNGIPNARHAGFWVDIFVPADTAPGAYKGVLSVKAGRDSISVPVELQVAKAAIPDDCCLHVSMNNYADAISAGWPGLSMRPDRCFSARYRRIEQGVFRTAHEHRMFLHYLPYSHSGYVQSSFAPPLAGEGPRKHVVDWIDWDRHFGPYFDGSAFARTRRGPIPVTRFYLPLNLCWPADFVKFGRPGYETEWRSVGAQLVDHFRKKGWTRTRFDMFLNHKQRFRFFPWDTEEARFLEDNDVHRYFRMLWKGTYDRKSTLPVKFDYTLGTTWTYHLDIKSDFADFIDVFIAGTGMISWFHDLVPGLHRKGRQIWSCANSGSIPGSPRAPAFLPLLMWMLDVDGYMPYWCTMAGWGSRGVYGLDAQGATTFLYSGSEFGSEETLASLRMKVQRNALQTMDRLQTAARRGGAGKPAVRKAVHRLLGTGSADWLAKRPDFVLKKLPQDWEAADWATQEPPVAGWKKFDTGQFRALRAMALGPIGGK